VTRSVNHLFTGREGILSKIEEILQRSFEETDVFFQRRFVITGMGGQGKSEICLKIANTMRQRYTSTPRLCHDLHMTLMNDSFWGIFWVDVSTATLAETGFLNIAKRLGVSAETMEEARQILANVEQPWLLILDNADDHLFDYQSYFPTGYFGVVLMTSRNLECSRYATVGCQALEGLDKEDAPRLLLKAAEIPADQCSMYDIDVRTVATLLGSHPLALIQAGSYVARGHCTLQEYPQVYQRHRQRLLQFHCIQEQSRYRHVYATFEASADVLESSSDETTQDALQLLSVLSMISSNRLPLSIFETAWKGARKISLNITEDDDVGNLSAWHVSQLVSLVQADANEWDSFRVFQASHLLKSLSLVFEDTQDGLTSISMHPLTHAWAKDRQGQKAQEQAWASVGSMIAVSDFDTSLWPARQRQLRPHLHCFLDRSVMDMFSCGPRLMIVQILSCCGWLLHQLQDNTRLFALLSDTFSLLKVDSTTPHREWLILYDLAASNLLRLGKTSKAVQLLEQVVKIREQNQAEGHPNRLASQHELAGAHLANGQVKEAVQLLEHVVKIREQILAEDHLDRLMSQHDLAGAYLANGKVEEAVRLLEHVVKIEEQIQAEDHPGRLTSQHGLATAYKANGQVKEAVQLLEHVVKIEEQVLAEDHPDRLASRHMLAQAYEANGQVREAVQLLEHVVKIREQIQAEDHPDRLASQHELARAYEANGRVKEAVQLLEHVVKIRELILTEDHPERLTSQHALAPAYRTNGQVKEAVQLLEHVVKIREQILAEDHPHRLTSQHALAVAYRSNGQVKEAVQLLEHVIKVEEEILAEDHPQRLTSQHALAVAYRTNGQVKVAVQLLEYVVKIREQIQAEDHPDRLASQHELARAYHANGEADTAVMLMEHVVEVKQKSMRENHPSRHISENVLKWFRATHRQLPPRTLQSLQPASFIN
jgi:tetratricopeptide (TPR) repeat protein